MLIEKECRLIYKYIKQQRPTEEQRNVKMFDNAVPETWIYFRRCVDRGRGDTNLVRYYHVRSEILGERV